jgi:hypothetical protein
MWRIPSVSVWIGLAGFMVLDLAFRCGWMVARGGHYNHHAGPIRLYPDTFRLISGEVPILRQRQQRFRSTCAEASQPKVPSTGCCI